MTISELKTLATRARRKLERTLFPLGNSVECPFCGWTGWRFLSAGDRFQPNRLCPRCGSLERYRMLPFVAERELRVRTPHVLEMAPKRCFTDYCRRQPGWRYFSGDLSSPTAMVRCDLRKMPIAESSLDLVVVFHVMEHIKDDGPAFREIGRMLKPDGLGVVCVPLQGAVTQEGAPESEWERVYGQADHVRLYGWDIEDRMRAADLKVQRIDTLSYFSPTQLDRNGLRGDDQYLFFVRKA